jgi:outer membrane protein assembly factor BamA
MVCLLRHGGEVLKVFSNRIGVAIFFCALAGCASGRSPCRADSSLEGRRIAEVMIFGNERTRPETILREMKIRSGDAYDANQIEADRKRIQNLGIFNRVEMIVDVAGEGVRIVVLVTESLTFIPYPVLNINERDWKKVSYGAGLKVVNLRGRAETLDALLSAGYDPNYRFSYVDPWIEGTGGLQAGLEAYFTRLLSKHFRDEKAHENQLGFFVQIGKRLTLTTTLSVLLGYREVSISPSHIGPLEYGRDLMPVAGLSAILDHRDLKDYPNRGYLLSLSARKTGWPSMRSDYTRIATDVRGYIPVIDRCTFAFRNAIALTAGAVPVYDGLFLGYEERIRGHWSETAEGENRWIASASLRFPLIKIRYFDLAETPESMNLKFGVSFGLFADAGTVWTHRENRSADRILFGYGAGLHFHLPIIDVLRLEAAFDEKGRREWILDIGADI